MASKVSVVFGLAFVEGMDQGLVTSSLNSFMADVGGSRRMYGNAIAAFYLTRLCGLPVYGWLADHNAHTFERIFSCALFLGIIGSLVYSLAPFGKGPELIVLSRAILGLASANSAAEVAYLAFNVSTKERTKFIGLREMVFTMTITVSPVCSALFVMLPEESIGKYLFLSSSTYCGYALALSNFVVLAYFILSKKYARNRACEAEEHERSAIPLLSDGVESLSATAVQGESATTCSPGERTLSLDTHVDSLEEEHDSIMNLLKNIRESGAWLFFLTSFQNNFNQQVVQWATPIIVLDSFGWGQAEVGYIFFAVGLAGFSAISIVVRLNRFIKDRVLFLACQSLVGLGVLLMLLQSYDARQRSKASLLLVLLFYWIGAFGQIPTNIGLFSKIVDRQMQGKYHALLQMCMASSRMVAGLMVGVCYSVENGENMLWMLTLFIWGIQIPFVSCMWNKLDI